MGLGKYFGLQEECIGVYYYVLQYEQVCGLLRKVFIEVKSQVESVLQFLVFVIFELCCVDIGLDGIWMNGWTDICMYVWVNIWMYGWIDGFMDV